MSGSARESGGGFHVVSPWSEFSLAVVAPTFLDPQLGCCQDLPFSSSWGEECDAPVAFKLFVPSCTGAGVRIQRAD